ncbi:MerR family transcriptional regulator [Pseudorhodoferax sp.]|uniref:MerR family transcriptional regulator n=1 Tax=Pseudorhodoferax sp. TaxID=1993553 RepID=UPI002DD64F7F|nr:MerR family transcriptional regulator [Pseudorhodoferax sp.]
MTASARLLLPAEAARRLGVSTKALRVYEAHGLLAPARSPGGWRLYRPADLARGARIVALRGLGLGLAEMAGVLDAEGAGDGEALPPALQAHEDRLAGQARALARTLAEVRQARADLVPGPAALAFALPWPWGGERFCLPRLAPLNYIVGPLGSGKTRLALELARQLPGASFLGLDRVRTGWGEARLAADPALRLRVDWALAALAAAGAQQSAALRTLLAALEAEPSHALVVDLVEQDLDHATQHALAAYLRRSARAERPLFLLTRSSVVLDLAQVGRDTGLVLCPANHSPPMLVEPTPGAPGYEALASCLATPAVRARTQGMVAWLPQAA